MLPQQAHDVLFGKPRHSRQWYLLIAASVTLCVWAVGTIGELAPWFRSHLWLTALIGSFVSMLAGWDNQGVATGYLGTGLYVTLIWRAFYTLSTGIEYSLFTIVTRYVLVIGTMTAVLSAPSYFLGVGAYHVSIKRNE